MELIDNPSGKVPEGIVKLYGDVPPVVESDSENALPTVAFNPDDGVERVGEALTPIVSDCVTAYGRNSTTRAIVVDEQVPSSPF